MERAVDQKPDTLRLGTVMNAEGVAGQAVRLTPRVRGVLCLLALWVLEPVLSLDLSETGRDAAHRAWTLYEQAWDAVLNASMPLAAQTEELVASSDELQLDEEPYDASLYRLYFLAALLYALGSYTSDSQDDFVAFLQRISDTIQVLNSDGFSAPDGMAIDRLMLEAIQELENCSELTAPLAEELRGRFSPARAAWQRAVQSSRS